MRDPVAPLYASLMRESAASVCRYWSLARFGDPFIIVVTAATSSLYAASVVVGP